MAETMYRLGPVGNEYVYGKIIWDEKGRSEPVQIFLSFANRFVHQTLSRPGSIKSIGFQYLEDGKVVLSQVFGDPKFPGPKFSTAKLDYPSEYITGLSGYCDSDSIEELTIHTNKKSHGPFGQGGSHDAGKFSFEIGEDNQFGGFHGAHNGGSITAIGLYIKPKAPTLPLNTGAVPKREAV